MNSIELHRLTKSFPNVGRAVDDLSLSINPGEFVTLLGPSGCGKTTTLRLIAGFEYPDQGTVRVNGVDVTDDPPYRRPVNTVFQDYALFPHMTVAKNVGYGMWVAGRPKAEISRQVSDALQLVGLTEKASARPSELSGGQRQRVAFARAIVRRPKVLLLDEPLSALDAKLREAMQVELRHLHRHLGITFLLVTHDQTEAMVLSDRVLIMEKGRVLQDGSPTELYNHPVSPYVANFLGTSNLVSASALETRGHTLTARIGEAVVQVPSAGREITPGSSIVLAIRPERVAFQSIIAKDSLNSSTLVGRVIEHMFHGNAVRTVLDIGMDSTFLVDTQLGSQAELATLPQIDSRCMISIDAPSVVIFPEDSVR